MLVSDMEMSAMRRKRAGPNMGVIVGHARESEGIAHGVRYRPISALPGAWSKVRRAPGPAAVHSWGSNRMVPLSVRAVTVLSEPSEVSTSVSISPLATVSKTA